MAPSWWTRLQNPHGRPPRLPMMLGLTVLTVMAHFLVAAAHLVTHFTLGREGILLGLLFAFAPFVGVWLIMNDRPRHGAILVTLTMTAAAAHTLYTHYFLLTDPVDTTFYAWVGQMLLAFELQGFGAGATLIIKPEVPRPREAETPA